MKHDQLSRIIDQYLRGELTLERAAHTTSPAPRPASAPRLAS